MILSHKIEMNPNKTQVTKLLKACGCARFSYNWGLNKWNEMYVSWKGNNTLPRPNAFLIKKEFNKIKETEFPWIYESCKDANQQPFTNLGKAFTKFFKTKKGHPQFKKKSGKKSFYVSNDKFKISENIIVLPLIGEINLKEKLRFEGSIVSCTISFEASKWFASINLDLSKFKKEKINKNEVVGVDLGLNSFATLSDGSSFKAPKPLKKYSNKLKVLQRKHSRKQKGSKNKEKSRIKLSKLHYKIKSIRNDFLHKLSTKICSENQTIVLEDLKVINMLKNHKLAKSISDVSWAEFRRQIQYKSEIYDNKIIIANTYYPSSKTCSKCDEVNHNLNLSDRIYKCSCGLEIDRDLNASLNLCTLGYRGSKACGHSTSTLDLCQEASIMDEARIKTVNKINTYLHI